MKVSVTSSPSVPVPSTVVLSENSPTQETKKSRPKLSIIWLKEFDGEHQRLVARWVTQD